MESANNFRLFFGYFCEWKGINSSFALLVWKLAKISAGHLIEQAFFVAGFVLCNALGSACLCCNLR
jgi:hypothetical protein